MDILTPPPSVINALFAKKFESSPVEATNYFYWLNQMSGYLCGSEHDSDNEECTCPLCFENEGRFVYNSAFLKKTRRFVRLNLEKKSWGYQLNPLTKDKEIGLFFSENHAYLFMNNRLLDRMINIVDLYNHYEILYSAENSLNGHGYLVGKRPEKIHSVDCHQTLPFFKDSLFNYNSLGQNELTIKTPKSKDLWLIISYVFALTTGIKKELFNTDFEYVLTKIEKEYQIVIKLKEDVRPKSKDNWLRTIELLNSELEVRY